MQAPSSGHLLPWKRRRPLRAAQQPAGPPPRVLRARPGGTPGVPGQESSGGTGSGRSGRRGVHRALHRDHHPGEDFSVLWFAVSFNILFFLFIVGATDERRPHYAVGTAGKKGEINYCDILNGKTSAVAFQNKIRCSIAAGSLPVVALGAGTRPARDSACSRCSTGASRRRERGKGDFAVLS